MKRTPLKRLNKASFIATRLKNKPIKVMFFDKKKIVKKKAKRNLKKWTLAALKRKLDTVFSRYVRQKYLVDGLVACYTCGNRKTINKIQNGHFISRQYLATRWSEDNCRPQCWGCNGYGRGQILIFEEKLIEEIGQKRVNELKASRHTILKLDRQWYDAQITKYSQLCATGNTL